VEYLEQQQPGATGREEEKVDLGDPDTGPTQVSPWPFWIAKLKTNTRIYCYIHQIGTVKKLCFTVSATVVQHFKVNCIAQGHINRFFAIIN
jgi:hypothetical protein